MLGESKTDDLTESMVSLFLFFGERRNDDKDLEGLVGREAKAFGNEGGSVFLWIASRI